MPNNLALLPEEAAIICPKVGSSALVLSEVLSIKGRGPVVQSIVSLTSSLRGQLVKCFTT